MRKKELLRLFHVFLLFSLAACSPHVIKCPAPGQVMVPGTQRPYCILGKTYYPLPSAEGFKQTGLASWYGKDFHGKKTANGEKYDMYGGTAAHKTLPMNTYVLVHNLENGRETVVRINDRGPFVKGRIIDLTYTAAKKLDMIKNGTARVRISALGEAVTVARGQKQIERFLAHRDFNKGEFFVQIGSFADRTNAERLKDRMLASGRKTVIQHYKSNGQRYHRVQVWAGTDLGQAQQLERVMADAGFPDAFVIAR
jgi:rare lipoprotein A